MCVLSDCGMNSVLIVGENSGEQARYSNGSHGHTSGCPQRHTASSWSQASWTDTGTEVSEETR